MMFRNPNDSTTPPGWPFMVAAAVLIYVPKLLVDAAFGLAEWVRDGDDNLQEM